MLKIDRIQYSGYEILYPDPETAMVTAVYVFTTFMYFQISLVLWIKMSALPRWVPYGTAVPGTAVLHVLHHILFILNLVLCIPGYYSCVHRQRGIPVKMKILDGILQNAHEI